MKKNSVTKKKLTIEERRAILNKRLQRRAKRKKIVENVLCFIAMWVIFGGLYLIAEIVY